MSQSVSWRKTKTVFSNSFTDSYWQCEQQKLLKQDKITHLLGNFIPAVDRYDTSSFKAGGAAVVQPLSASGRTYPRPSVLSYTVNRKPERVKNKAASAAKSKVKVSHRFPELLIQSSTWLKICMQGLWVWEGILTTANLLIHHFHSVISGFGFTGSSSGRSNGCWFWSLHWFFFHKTNDQTLHRFKQHVPDIAGVHWAYGDIFIYLSAVKLWVWTYQRRNSVLHFPFYQMT